MSEFTMLCPRCTERTTEKTHTHTRPVYERYRYTSRGWNGDDATKKNEPRVGAAAA